MPLSSGHRLGVYEIVAPLGAGGMGEVYRAKDSKLKREVAIKVLPADVAADPERLARFQREAEVLASLNHPHIAHVYGIEGNALVMELVEGEDLAERIRRGPIPIDEALPIAKQIAEALEAAHDAGIVHRDLKPANIKVRDDGTVKVLDFGLARSSASGASGASGAPSAHLANSPTITSPAMTMQGVILGTAAYMAPEQAKGKAVDKRADIWAFGCVLYEMLTAKRAFKGDDVTDIITSVMRDTPDWSALPADTPATVRTLLRRCLDKDPRKRAPHMAIARMEIDDAMTTTGELVGGVATGSHRSAWPLAIGIGVAMAAAASALTLWLTRGESVTSDAPVFRYAITLPTSAPGTAISVSPDGTSVVVGGRDANGNAQIWVRALNGTDFVALTNGNAPFWSPDSREIGFFAIGRLMRVPAQGGAAREVASFAKLFSGTSTLFAATWGADGTILFGSSDGIFRVAASGGPIERASGDTAPGGKAWSSYNWPQWLPGQTGFLYTALTPGAGTAGLLVHQPIANGKATALLETRVRSQITAHGLLLALVTGQRAAELRLHQFDPAAGRIDEPGTLLAADASPNFSASDSGVLVYRKGSDGAAYRFEWVDAKGQSVDESFDTIDPAPFYLSHDGTVLAYSEAGGIKIRDLSRGVTTPLVQASSAEVVLSPDGSRVAYSVVGLQRPSIVIQPTSGGTPQTVYEATISTLVEDWSTDGKYLAANEGGRKGLIIAIDGKQPPQTYADLPPGAGVDESRFSPDGRWLVYNAAEAGRQDVFLTPLPPTGERWQVSLAGGSQGRWRRDGRAVYYLASSGELMMVDVELTPGSRPKLSRPRSLFATGLRPTTNMDQFAPNADGSRFLLRRPRGEDGSDQLEVIINWPGLIKK